MQFPNRIQVAMLFDRKIDALEAGVRDFARIEEMKTGATFNVPETNPGKFYRLFNGDEELMLTFEYIDGPANPDAFRGALSSPVVGILTPDIRDRIAQTGSHVLLEASHGVLSGVENNPEIASFLGTIGRGPAGATPRQRPTQPRVPRSRTLIITSTLSCSVPSGSGGRPTISTWSAGTSVSLPVSTWKKWWCGWVVES